MIMRMYMGTLEFETFKYRYSFSHVHFRDAEAWIKQEWISIFLRRLRRMDKAPFKHVLI